MTPLQAWTSTASPRSTSNTSPVWTTSFAGEPLDLNVEWQYHRARWMDPTTGRFEGMDPWQGSLREPGTLHRYSYVSSSVVDRVDPTGKFALVGVLAVVATLLTLAGFWIGCTGHRTTKTVYLDWQNSFVYNRPRPGLGEAPELLQPQKTETVKERMHARFSQAYAGMTVNLTEGMTTRQGDQGLVVLDDCCDGDAGATVGRHSEVSYETVVSGAHFALAGPSRPALVNGIGEGLGAIIAHEVFHHFVAGGDQRVERGTYDYWKPLQQEGASDGSLRWSDAARRALGFKLGGP
jgi:RHS repeat-associated protein